MNLKEHLKKNGIDENLIRLILLVSEKTKTIQKAFHTHTGQSDTHNIYGEKQLKLDKWADEVLINAFRESNLVRTIASEEQQDIIEIIKSEGSYGVVFDPLDGSSLVGVNLSIGTIVGIFDEGNVLEKGSLLDAVVYVIYGPLTTLTYTVKKGVHEFVLTDEGDYILSKENIRIPEGNIYAPGALRKDWLHFHRRYIDELEKKGFKLRYSGSFVADFNQIMHRGGVFTYPADKKHKSGKLRLLFEVNPLSFIATQAGGKASDGRQNILNIKPKAIDDRVPVYIGSKSAIDLIEEFKKQEEGEVK